LKYKQPQRSKSPSHLSSPYFSMMHPAYITLIHTLSNPLNPAIGLKKPGVKAKG